MLSLVGSILERCRLGIYATTSKLNVQPLVANVCVSSSNTDDNHYKFQEHGVDENSSDEVLGRLKKTAVSLLPEGWREWRVRVGFDSMIDPAILNKLRFCLPAIDIARAFDPEASCLKERPYRDMKYKC
nr:unnamed protein product [Callosobruchus analis]